MLFDKVIQSNRFVDSVFVRHTEKTVYSLFLDVVSSDACWSQLDDLVIRWIHYGYIKGFAMLSRLKHT